MPCLCEGRAETRLLGGVEQAGAYPGVPCSAPSQDSLVLTTRATVGLWSQHSCGPVTSPGSPHHITGSWPREAHGGHAVCVPGCASVRCSSKGLLVPWPLWENWTQLLLVWGGVHTCSQLTLGKCQPLSGSVSCGFCESLKACVSNNPGPSTFVSQGEEGSLRHSDCASFTS